MLKHHKRLLAAAMALAVSVVLASAGAAGASARPQARSRPVPVLRVNRPAPEGVKPQPVGVVPLRVPNPAAYAAQKAAAARRAGKVSPSPPAPAGPAPTILRNWQGLQDKRTAPPDSTGAIGPTRYIELVNRKVAIYTRTSNTPTASGSLDQLTGCVTSPCAAELTDPQVIWDPDTKRFYYAALDLLPSSKVLLDIGFSTTATPTLSASSWCRYSLNFGSVLPDYPKLGDTKDFILIGTNNFSASGFEGSRITWMRKPPSGTACPAPSTLKSGVTGMLKNANGTDAWTPVPANQTDTSSTGWAAAIPRTVPYGGTGTFLTLFKITKSATGSATIPTTGTSVPVTAYTLPANASQPGMPFSLDTLDGRPTQAVSAIDPAHGGAMALWTQHTVFGGAGAQVRWYEISPATPSLIQNGTISSSSKFTYNGAISPDRLVNGTTKKYGGAMVINVNQSSPTMLPAIEVASKIGANPVSALKLIAQSAAPDRGRDCLSKVCLWGDYAGASPDPSAPTTGTTGNVWGSSMLSALSAAGSFGWWTTQNFAIRP